MEITCIMCPVGCNLIVEKDRNGKVTVSNNNCPRGAIYGEKEVTSPERMVTTVKKYKTGTISLKTQNPIPKKLVKDCLIEISKAKEPINIKTGDVFIKNILNTNVDVVVTNINL